MSALTHLCYKMKSPRAARIYEVGLTPMLTLLLACQAHSSPTQRSCMKHFHLSRFLHQLQLIQNPKGFSLFFIILLFLPSLHCDLSSHLHMLLASSLFQTPNIYFPNANLWNIGKDLGLPLWRQHCSSQPSLCLLLYFVFVQPDEVMPKPSLFGTWCDTSPNRDEPNLCSHVRSR